MMRSRRKSVSFAVYKVNADTMQFDIEHKSVLLGNLSDKLSNVILGSSGLNELDKADEKFRNRRRELMEKAKSLEEQAARAKAASSAASMTASMTASMASATLASVSVRDKTKNKEDETAI